MSDVFEQDRRSSRRWVWASATIALLLFACLVLWLLFFRGSSASSVDTVEADVARQEAIAEAAEANDEGQPAPATQATPVGQSTDEEPGPAESAPPLDDGQNDAAANVGALDGEWSVDTSIGTFTDDCLTSVCGASFVGFRIDEELAGIGAKTVVGRTPGVSGTMQISGSSIVAATFVADMTSLTTDDPGRTSALRGPNGGLETDEYPEATFTLTNPIELGSLPAEGASVEVTAVGDLTVHGVTQSVTIPLTAEMQAGLIVVFGSLDEMLLSDYDIPKPTAIVVVSVADVAAMELQLFLSR